MDQNFDPRQRQQPPVKNTMPTPEIEPPSSPITPTAFDQGVSQPVMPTSMQPQKKSRRGLWIGIVTAVVVLLGGAAAAYQFWYQNPEKVIADSIVHALNAKTTSYNGVVDVDMMGTKIVMNYDGVYDAGAQSINGDITMGTESQEIGFKASAVVDRNSDAYLRVGKLDMLLAMYLQGMTAEDREKAMQLIDKVNDRWVKVEATSVAEYDQRASRVQTCWSNAVQQTEYHPSFLQELAASYQKNKFVQVAEQLGQKDSSFGYRLEIDQDKAKTFIADLKNTQAYRTLHECDSSLDLQESMFDFAKSTDNIAARIEVWVGMFDHKLTKLHYEVKSKDPNINVSSIVDLYPVFDKPVDIAAPQDAISLKDLQTDLQDILQRWQQQQAQRIQLQTGLDEGARERMLRLQEEANSSELYTFAR